MPTDYTALISSGTFTHGHLGPEVLINLLSLCRDNALLTIGVNAAHYSEKNFAKSLNELQATSRIKIMKSSKQSIYSNKNELDNDEEETAII